MEKIDAPYGLACLQQPLTGDSNPLFSVYTLLLDDPGQFYIVVATERSVWSSVLLSKEY